MQKYIVKKSDTLWKIAKDHGIDVNTLAKINGMTGDSANYLSIGQVILLPDDQDPDTVLTLIFRGLDFTQFKPNAIWADYDGKGQQQCELTGDKTVVLSIFDHSKGLKVWIEDLEKEQILIAEKDVLPLGVCSASIDSRLVKVVGNMLPEVGKQESSAAQVKKETTAKAESGTETVQQQVRTEGGAPTHALATLYTEENFRLVDPLGAQYRDLIIQSAKKYSVPPQALAAIMWAESGFVSKAQASTSSAQGLGQFIDVGWLGVYQDRSTLLAQDYKPGLEEKLRHDPEFLAKRLDPKYAIDGNASFFSSLPKHFTAITRIPIPDLPVAEKAKLIYAMYHEGALGFVRLMGLDKNVKYDNKTGRAMLETQIGVGKKAEEKIDRLIDQFGGDSVKAYQYWLFYLVTDTRVNTKNYLVKDLNPSEKIRPTAEIVASICSQPPVPKAPPRKNAPKPTQKSASSTPPGNTTSTAPKPAVTPAAPQPTASSQTPATAAQTPNSATLNSISKNGEWCDPLDVCTIRSKVSGSTRDKRFGAERTKNDPVTGAVIGHYQHQGVDLAAEPGTPIKAVASGTIVFTPHSGNYGNTILLLVDFEQLSPEHLAVLSKRINVEKAAAAQKKVGFFYAHLTPFDPPFNTGGKMHVHAGDVIGKTGHTGNANLMTTIEKGSHLHFELRIDGTAGSGMANLMDPLLLIQNCTNRNAP